LLKNILNGQLMIGRLIFADKANLLPTRYGKRYLQLKESLGFIQSIMFLVKEIFLVLGNIKNKALQLFK